MPNWCENEIKISGEQEVIELIHKAAKESHEDKGFFSHFFPRPENEEEDWCNWNTLNWGTKWDITPYCDSWKLSELITKDKITSFSLSIDTPWSPPEQFLKSLCEKYNLSAELRYIEGGMDFCGKLSLDGKLVIEDFSGEINRTNMEKAGFDPEYIEDYMECIGEDEE